jgi:hypothetical protein
MRCNELLHRIGVLVSRGFQEIVKGLRRGNREDRRIDHGAAPLLPIRCRDLDA